MRSLIQATFVFAAGVFVAGGLPPLHAQETPLRAERAGNELRLSMRQAVELALSSDGNLGVQISQRAEDVARGRSGQALSALLPQLESTSSFTDFNRSFGALGLTTVQLPFGLRVPQRVGPLQVTDVRGQVSTTVFNLGAVRQYQAAGAAVRVAEAESEALRDQISAEVVRHYVDALRAAALVEAVQANIDLAQATYEQAQRHVGNGTGTGLEVTRAEVDLTFQRQRMVAARNELSRANLALLRAMGQPLETVVVLTDRLSYTPLAPAAMDVILSRAETERADLEAQRRREEAARLSLSAAQMERLPTVSAFADYGVIGNVSQTLQPTRTLGIALNIPIFDGGRTNARTSELSNQYRMEQLRTRHTQQDIELQIRMALTSLSSAEEQVKTAEAGLRLSESEATQVERRYANGLASSLEVTTAQAGLARARDSYIEAMYTHTLVRMELANAAGVLMEMIP